MSRIDSSVELVECSFLSNSICEVSTLLADMEVQVSDDACRMCRQHVTHPMAINEVTCSRAVATRLRSGQELTASLRTCLEQHHDAKFVPLEGVGRECKKMIDWYLRAARLLRLLIAEVRPEECGCEQFMLLMNTWGPDGCLRRRQEIISRFVAKTKKYVPVLMLVPFLGWLIFVLVLHPAIKRARAKGSANEAVVAQSTLKVSKVKM